MSITLDPNKKTIAVMTDAPMLKSGLGRNGKDLAKYLYKTGKYNVVYFAQQGRAWSDPELKKLPFLAHGVLPDNQQELIAVQNDPARFRDASYGALKIDEFVKEVKPFAMIFSNDSWAFPYWNKSWWNKFHCLPHITLDSTPFLPDQIEFIKNSKTHYVWAKFAQEEAARLGHSNVKTIPAIIDNTPFRPLSENERLELRKKFKIAPDTFICGFVFRSQVRKEVKPLLEGFAEFKRLNPEVKNAKLLLHTNFTEGWDIPRLLNDVGLTKHDILTTYYCRDCGAYEVKELGMPDQPCPYCGSEKGQTFCGIHGGVTEEQLNEVFNIMDCYCHLANAGGCEMPIIEALYAGLPLATVPYSFGKTFTDEPWCQTIDCAYTVQHQTQFSRAVPYPSSVAKFLKKIYNSDKWARNQLGEKGRKFALATFSPEVVGGIWEKIIDELPKVDYDFTPKMKNPNYVPPENLSDNDFISSLYDNLLFQPEPENGEGRQHWLGMLKQGISRQDVYSYFVKVAVDDNAKNTKIGIDSLFDKDDEGRRILFAMPTDAEDVINLTSLLKSCKETYPDYNIYVSTKPEHKALLKNNQYIHRWINFIPDFENVGLMEGVGNHKGHVNILFLPYIQTSKIPCVGHNGLDKNNFNTLSQGFELFSENPYIQTK